MGALIRAHDWEQTRLGAPHKWPASLKSAVRTMLSTRHPIFIFWGAESLCFYNDSYRPSLGLEKHPAMLGQPARDYWGEIWPSIKPQIDLVLEGKGSTWHENQHLPIVRNGKLEDVFWTYSYGPIDDATAPNCVGGVLVICTETTKQVLAERRASEGVMRHLRMFEQAPGFIAVLSGNDHVFEFVNSSYRALMGDRDYLGRTVREAIPEAAGQGFFELLDQVYLTGQQFAANRVPLNIKRDPDEAIDPRLVDFVYAPVFGDDGTIIGVFVEGQDMTAVHRAEIALQASDARYRTLTEALPQLVWTCDAEGQCDYLSRQWTDFTGCAEAEQLGLGWLDRVHPDDRERTRDHWLGAVAGRHDYDIEFRIRRHDDVYCWFKTRATPEVDQNGNILSWFGTSTDIEDIVKARDVLSRSSKELDRLVRERTAALERAQEALRQSQKLEAMGQLTGGVAHDFNNLLTPILGGLDMLQRAGIGGPREQRILSGALTSAERAKTLVQRLLSFARRQPLQAKSIDLRGLVTGMADLIASTSGPRIRVDVVVPDALPFAKADGNQLEMALLNLAVNSRDAMPEGGTLTISLAEQVVPVGHRPGLHAGHFICLSVADTGTGMDVDTLARAVEPFFSTKGVGRGTGLGLSMVHGLAAQLGGAMAVRSTPGLGTVVELWIPVSAEAPEPGVERAKQSGLAGRGTVLLVDDEELVRMNTADMLLDLGFEVIEAGNGAQALTLLSDGAGFDILLTDHLMPGMTGEELAMLVQAERPEVSILVVSGYAETDGLAPHLARLAKPFRRDELANAMGALTF